MCGDVIVTEDGDSLDDSVGEQSEGPAEFDVQMMILGCCRAGVPVGWMCA